MEKNYVKAAASVAVLAAVVMGCSKVSEETSGEALKVSANVMETKSEMANFSSSVIGVYVDDANDAYSPAKNSTATVSSGSTGVATSPAININAAATVYGYYPAVADELTNPDSTTSKSISVGSSDDFAATTQTDYLWSTPVKVSKSNRTASLTFNHALSKLVFSISLGSDYAGTGAMTGIKLSTSSATGEFKTGSGSMKIKDGSISDLSATKELSYTGSRTLSTTATTVTALVAPATLAASTEAVSTITITLTIDGSDYSNTLPVSTVASWVGGSSYTYSIGVGSGSLSMGSVSITDWSTGGTTSVTVE
jgi:hypothetical protein